MVRVRVIVMVRVIVWVRVNPSPNPNPCPNPNHNQPDESPSNQSEARIPESSYTKKEIPRPFVSPEKCLRACARARVCMCVLLTYILCVKYSKHSVDQKFNFTLLTLCPSSNHFQI